MKKTKGFFNTNRKVRIVDVLFKDLSIQIHLIGLSDNNASANCVASTHILRIEDFDRLLEVDIWLNFHHLDFVGETGQPEGVTHQDWTSNLVGGHLAIILCM